MAEQKKRGFHGLEQRIHEMEAEHEKGERSASGGEAEKRQQPQSDQDAARKSREEK